jgi:hypothetical protein
MDYKKIIKSPSSRAMILDFLRFIPDEMMLKLQYKIKTGRKLELNHPERYTEKLQWYKLNYKNPVMHQCVDKYKVRDYVREKNLEHILINLIAKYDSVDVIDWDSLPNQFVMKTTNGGGGLNVVVCSDKSQLDFESLKTKLMCKKAKPKTGGREWAYYGIEPGIIVEDLLVNDKQPEAGINDYKIFCYGGKAKYIVVDVDRYVGHKRNFYDIEWNNLNIKSDCPSIDRELEKPDNFEEMVKIAEKLSGDFPYVRVDLYNISGKIYFGELTFYPWSGYVKFSPDAFDYELGIDFNCQKWGG